MSIFRITVIDIFIPSASEQDFRLVSLDNYGGIDALWMDKKSFMKLDQAELI